MASPPAAGRPIVVDPIVMSVAQIKAYVGDDIAMVGSGFFYANRGITYYITNRHLVIMDNDNYFPDRMSITLHTDPHDIRRHREVLVDCMIPTGTPPGGSIPSWPPLSMWWPYRWPRTTCEAVSSVPCHQRVACRTT